jgi:uncharacterized protein (DUF111 family)
VGGSCREVPVPVTAKLSRQFYEGFGDEIANELVLPTEETTKSEKAAC